MVICPKCGKRLTITEGFDLDTYIVTCAVCGYRKEYADRGTGCYPQRFKDEADRLRKLQEG